MEIVTFPDSRLRSHCVQVEEITKKEKEFFEQMLGFMKAHDGVGLAAPQVGILRRLIVADIGEGPVKLANPVLLKSSGADNMEEGCLSVPGTRVNIIRPNFTLVTGMNEKGEHVEIKAQGLMARVLQHELDHLNGKMIIDYMPLFDRLKFGITRRVNG